MGRLVVLFLFLVYFFQEACCFKFEDLLPIKHDVIRVSNESQMREVRNERMVLNFIGLVERHGYTAEEYKLTTRDGYILALHRITGSPLNPRAPGKPAVFLQHGLFLSSDTFVLIGPGKDLAYLLADAGYDVWFGNARGNTYSRSHVFLSPKEKKFWEFSYHEIGIIDLSASIDYVLRVTGQRRLIYVGYSMGTTEGFALLSTLPEYNERISLFICLAPIVFWRHKLPSTMRFLVDNFKAAEEFSARFQYYEVLPQSSFTRNLGKKLCSDKTVKLQQMICTNFLTYVAPVADISRFNTSAFPIILSHFPAGTSFQSLRHYVQNINSGEFQAYDYGPKINYAKYSKKTPPHYNLKRVTAPVALFYGNNDYFATPEDNIILLKHLRNVVAFEKIPNNQFNHLDILWSKDSNRLLYNTIISLMHKYTY